ncbi:MAG: hypothetical protein AAGA43_12635 [Bacteroidota bacterium]
MKQLVVLMMALVSISAFSQRHEGFKKGKKAMAELSAEQLATLHTKKLTLALDLTESQQVKIMEISLEEAEFKKAKHEEFKSKKESGEWKKPSADERFEMANARLDHKIAHQQKMKQVLNKEQYQTWKELQLKRAMNGKKIMQKEGRRG